jgi:hypothetical protein
VAKTYFLRLLNMEQVIGSILSTPNGEAANDPLAPVSERIKARMHWTIFGGNFDG